MSDVRRICGTVPSSVDIEDAEFVEINEDGSEREAPTAQPPVKRRWGLGKIFAAGFGAMLVWMVFVERYEIVCGF